MSTVQTWTPRRSLVSIAMLIGPLALLWMVTSPAQGRTETCSSGGDFHATVLNSSTVFPGSSGLVSDSLTGRGPNLNPCSRLCSPEYSFLEPNSRPSWTQAETERFAFDSTTESRTGEVLRGQDGCPAWTLWSAGYGGGGQVQGAGIFAPGVDYSLGGVQLGMNRVVEDEYLVGVYGNFGHASFTRSGLGQSADVDGVGVGVLGCLYDHCGHTFVNVAYGYHDYSTLQELGPFVTTADYHSHLGAAYAERAWNASLLGFRFQPYAGLQYIQLHSSDFTASGLTVAGVDHGSLGSVLGIRTGWTHTTSRGWTIEPIVRATWFHEFLETQVTVNTSPAFPVAVDGLNFGRDRAVLGAGIELEGCRGTLVYFNYDLQVNTYHAIHVGSGGLALQW